MVVHNPNNWHWVDKNCLPWSKEYFQKEIIDTTFENDELKVSLDNVSSITGDCDVTQRKGKVLCIYDMKLQFSINGVSKNEDETFNGTITVPEFVHDQEDDEYVFDIEVENYKIEIRKFFIPILKQKLMNFQNDLVKAHEKDVQHNTN